VEHVDELEGVGGIERHLADAEEAVGVGFYEVLDGGDVLFEGDEESLAVEGGEFIVEFGEKGGVAVVVDVGVD
jgi:hypothetical protein